MAAMMRYLASLCCDADEEDNRPSSGGSVNLSNLLPLESSSPLSLPVVTATVERPPASDYQPVTTSHHDVVEDAFQDENLQEEAEEDCCCRAEDTTSSSSAMALHEHGLHEFFRTLRERWRRRDTFQHLSGTKEVFRKTAPTTRTTTPGLSPLRTASSYDTSHEIPTISLDEVVLPGSELQKQMAIEAARRLEEHTDECVICMDGFDPTNPRMPTLCGCGENKTYFHLPCLYSWIDQNQESTCPVCKEQLSWDEF